MTCNWHHFNSNQSTKSSIFFSRLIKTPFRKLLNLSCNHVLETQSQSPNNEACDFHPIIQTNKDGHFQPSSTKSISVISQPMGWHSMPVRKVFFSTMRTMRVLIHQDKSFSRKHLSRLHICVNGWNITEVNCCKNRL